MRLEQSLIKCDGAPRDYRGHLIVHYVTLGQDAHYRLTHQVTDFSCIDFGLGLIIILLGQ